MLRLSACVVFQNQEKQILFTKRTDSGLYGLPGGKLEPEELAMVQNFTLSSVLDPPALEEGKLRKVLPFIDNYSLLGFMLAAAREGAEETGLEVSSTFNPFKPSEKVFFLQPIFAGAINAPGTNEKEFFTVTFLCRDYSGECLSPEDLELHWAEIDFLLSEQVAFPDYNQKLFPVLQSIQSK